jgi:hypothetical protein
MASANDALIIVTGKGSAMIGDRKENTLHLRLDLVMSKLMTKTNRLAASIKYTLIKDAFISVIIVYRSKPR